jgi:predicted DNA-binding protein (MmcQ/YjbR family)
MASETKKAQKALHAFAKSLPGAWEDHPWGETVMKVGKKVFVFLGRDADDCGVSVKLRPSHAAALKMPFCTPTGYGLGKAGWVSAQFEKGDKPPVDLLCRWIEESYVAVAPKKLAKPLAEKLGALPPSRNR